jgi:bifunctional non-homologous end joining protein LigD
MSLRDYHRKRDFSKTKEPQDSSVSNNSQRIFVIQRHDASHLHYDFRLEFDGTLKSWAVPKGPSTNPADKRLAMQVEDHPIDYATFEGTIPKGQYGGGEVKIWDHGYWKPKSSDKSVREERTSQI